MNHLSENTLSGYTPPIAKAQRAAMKAQKPCCIWLTGLSGAGKTTIANQLERDLYETGYHTFVLDGDRCRSGISRDLGFSQVDRDENVRRIAEVAKLFVDAGLIVIVSLISPLIEQRRYARSIFEASEYMEIFVNTPLSVCEARDCKGLYKKARQGIISDFTGVSSPYEPPLDSDLSLDGTVSPSELVQIIRLKLATFWSAEKA